MFRHFHSDYDFRYDIYAPKSATEKMQLTNKLVIGSGGVYSVVIQHNVTNSAIVSTGVYTRDTRRDGNYRLSGCPGQVKMELDK